MHSFKERLDLNESSFDVFVCLPPTDSDGSCVFLHASEWFSHNRCVHVAKTLVLCQMLPWTEKSKETFCWGTWVMGCLSDPARLTAASGEEHGMLKRCLLQFWNIFFYKWTLLLYVTVSLRCSGSVTQTNGPTVHPRDSIPSSVLFTLLWWGLIFKFSISSNIQNLFRNVKFLKSFRLTFPGKRFSCRFSALPWELRTGQMKKNFLVFLMTFCLFLTLNFLYVFVPVHSWSWLQVRPWEQASVAAWWWITPTAARPKSQKPFIFTQTVLTACKMSGS